MENKNHQKGIKEFHGRLKEEMETPEAKIEKSALHESVFKIAIDRGFDFDIVPKHLFGSATKALRKNKLLHDVISYFYISKYDYDCDTNKLAVEIKLQPFYLMNKSEIYKRSGLWPTHIFIFTFLSHFR